ncbi:MAG: L-threonylcarbamoyladenylate synthase [Legionellaceae bacterium]|nr:L-threonylcarbamoyladenylate synthase [Legionellaceae bacterium]
MNRLDDLDDARQYVRQGLVIAYPTEAVYGLGCDPFNESAVLRIMALKQRSINQGLIVLIADWSQLYSLVGPVTDESMERVRASWPGATTWVFPKSTQIPSWLSGQHPSVAIRMTSHPIAAQLCNDGPLVSTSANIHGQEPARNVIQLQLQFPDGIDGVVSGDLGQASQPSAIYDVLTGVRLR